MSLILRRRKLSAAKHMNHMNLIFNLFGKMSVWKCAKCLNRIQIGRHGKVMHFWIIYFISREIDMFGWRKETSDNFIVPFFNATTVSHLNKYLFNVMKFFFFRNFIKYFYVKLFRKWRNGGKSCASEKNQ